jgi:hypothetical protein
VFVAYIIYLNVVGFHLGASKQRAAEFAPHRKQNVQSVAETEAKPHNTHFSGSPQMMKAVALKSIPHDTGAFTQVGARNASCDPHF